MSEIILAEVVIKDSGKFYELIKDFSRTIGARVTCFKFSKDTFILEVIEHSDTVPGLKINASDQAKVLDYNFSFATNFWISLPEMTRIWPNSTQSLLMTVHDIYHNTTENVGIKRYLKCEFEDKDYSHTFLSR
mgnify:FL=1